MKIEQISFQDQFQEIKNDKRTLRNKANLLLIDLLKSLNQKGLALLENLCINDSYQCISEIDEFNITLYYDGDDESYDAFEIEDLEVEDQIGIIKYILDNIINDKSNLK